MLTAPIYDARDYDTVQLALDAMAAANTGGILQLPCGTLDENSDPAFTGAVVKSDGITVRGAVGTILKFSETSEDTDMFLLQANAFKLEDVTLEGRGVAGDGAGVRDLGLDPNSDPRNIVAHVFRRVEIRETSSWAIDLVPSTVDGMWNVELDRVTAHSSKDGGSFRAGALGKATGQITCIGCEFDGSNGDGATETYGPGDMSMGSVQLINATQIAFYNCFLQPRNFSTSLSIYHGNSIRVADCHFESSTVDGDLALYTITTSGVVSRLLIDGCTFQNSQHEDDPRIIKSDDSENCLLRGAAIRDCEIYHVTTSLIDNDVALGRADDGILLTNNLVINTNSAAMRPIVYTERPGVGLGLQEACKASNQNTTSTTGEAIENVSVFIAPGEAVHFHACLTLAASSAGTGIQLGLHGPTGGSPVIDAVIVGWTSATDTVVTAVTAYDSYQGNTSSAGTSRRIFEIRGRVRNGSTGGALELRFRSSSGGQVTAYGGSSIRFSKGGPY